MLKLEIDFSDAAERLKNLKPVAGRMEKFGGENNQPLVIVDYAHTPDALEKVLSGLRLHTKGKLSVVFGCGGNRDKGKRAQMGRVAEEFADYVIITDDNPRFELSEDIIEDILSGFFNNEAKVIHEREKAIQRAIEHANAQDSVLIARLLF
jgi:UDP-N-acetylmuramoyl-L-alanyl-D-glutamate--2,6-diaminopimelate ligase